MHFSYGFCSEKSDTSSTKSQLESKNTDRGKVAQMESDTVRHRDVYRDVLSDIAVILILLLFI